jgi:FixJ family two-component response regulator
MTAEATVFVVDSDQNVRESLRHTLQHAGLKPETHPSAERFLEKADPEAPGCVVAGARLPGMGGLDLIVELARRGRVTPVVVLIPQGDVPAAVQAIETGASGCIEVPIDPDVLLARVRQAIDRDAAMRRARDERADVRAQFASLTSRQREVMEMVVEGCMTKEIARSLGLSMRTVEVHRCNVMRKMGAESLAELVAIVTRHGLGDRGARGER